MLIEILYVAGRILLGSLFIWASWDKIGDPTAFAKIVQNYRILPEILIYPVALVLPWLEAVCGFLLITGRWVHGAAATINMLLGVFIAALVISHFRGIDIDCGCFSVSTQNSSSLMLVLLRDILLLTIGVSVMGYQLKSNRHAHRKKVMQI